MRARLLTTVAAAALSFGVATAVAQTGAGGSAGDRTGSPRQAQPAAPSAPDSSAAAKMPSPGGSGQDSDAQSDHSGRAKRSGDRRPGAGASDTSQAKRAEDSSDPGSKAKRSGGASGESRGDQAGTRDQSRSGERSSSDAEKKGRRDGSDASDRTADRAKNGGAEDSADRDKRKAESGPHQERDRSSQDGGRDARAGSRADESQDKSTRQSSGSSRQKDAAESASSLSNLQDEQRTKIRQTFSREQLNTSKNVNISVSVGRNIPKRVRLRQVPSSIAEIVPQYRGYRYTVAHDEIVIVQPRTRKVVETISLDGSSHASSTTSSGGSIRLSQEQRSSVTRVLRHAGSTEIIREGATAPSCVELSQVPQSLASEMPELRGYRYFSIGNEVVLVEPNSRRIVSVLE